MAFSTQLQAVFAHAKGEVVPDFNDEHPAHPVIVHFPIAFNTLAWCLDILYALTTTIIRPRFLTSRFDDETTLSDITRLSHFLLCLGLLSTIPAIMSGGPQLMNLIGKNGGPWEKDTEGRPTDRMVPRIKMAITHAAINYFVVALNVYNWWTRRSTATSINKANVPSGTNMLISALLLPLLIGASKAGTRLVFNHGIGLNLGRKKFEQEITKPFG